MEKGGGTGVVGGSGIAGGILSATDRGENRELGAVGEGGGEAAGEAGVVLADEEVDVLAGAAGLVEDAVADGGVEEPECGERVGDGGEVAGEGDGAVVAGEGAEVGGEVD